MTNIYRDQSLYEHALCFDPINQQRFDKGDFRTRMGDFHDVPGCMSNPDGSFTLTYFAPGAKKVQVRGIGGSMPNTYDMLPSDTMPDYFTVTITDVPAGFHYIEFLVDGVLTIHNQLPIGYGCSYAMNFIDVYDPDFTWSMLRDVPHGTVHMEIYKSDVVGRYRNCYVYTPPSYDTDINRRYPVFYVQHGGGENESGWLWQGKINYIMDNMIAEGLCEEMIIIINHGFNFTENPDGTFRSGDIDRVLALECVPFIDKKYRTIPDRKYRACAGLSYGTIHSRMTVMGHPDLFSAVGIWSGSFGFDTITNATNNNPVSKFNYTDFFQSKEYFNERIKLMFYGCGDQEAGPMAPAGEIDKLIAEGYNIVRYVAPGYHEWSVWRRCAFEMLKLLFKW
ncbi:MAG: hypothetical protein IKD81_08345 [Eubacteriaceae bacterium]|nr:hypothetical protein [Eubacteriaceae bacterium]